jgi:hypothetical protein
MHLDTKLTTGILIGVVLGLKYYMSLALYLPILVVAAVFMIVKTLRHT